MSNAVRLSRLTLLWLLPLLACLGCAPLWAAETLQAQLDRAAIAEGETVNLLVSVPDSAHAEDLDVSALAQDFEVLGQTQSTQVRTVNGRTTATTSWQITLAPKRSGDLVVPPVRVGQAESPALVLQVRPAGDQAQAPGDQAVLLQAEVGPASGYVQAQFVYTVRLLYRAKLQSGSLSDPQAGNARVQKLGEDRNYQKTLDGQTYNVIERRYALFPDTSGSLEIPPVVFDGQVAVARDGRRSRSPLDDFFNDPLFGGGFDSQRLRLRSESVRLEVRPKPEAFPGDWWLPAQDLQLSESWAPEPPVFRVGEPVTRTLVARAKGVPGAQLPGLAPPGPPEIKAYPDQPQVQDGLDGEWVVGSREEKIALVPAQEGDFTLPEIRLPWWDTASDSLRYAVLPARTVHVLPALEAAARQPAPAAPLTQPAADAGFWPWLSAALGLAWLLTAAAWWRDRRPAPSPSVPAPPPGLDAARRALREACQAGRAPAAKQAALDWGRARWPRRPPVNLGGLGEGLEDAAARRALAELDRALYAPASAAWDGPACWAALEPVLRRAASAPLPAAAPLPRLYPQTLTH